MSTLDILLQNRLVVIARGLDECQVVPVAQALVDAGVGCLEIAFDHSSSDGKDHTLHALEILTDRFSNRLCVGAGTVLTCEEVSLAAQSGAKYIISPNTNADVIRETKCLGLVSVPGAMTPTECLDAVRLGADMVKLFPAGCLGISYFKALREPLKHIPFLVAAGITLENLPQYKACGAAAFGISSSILKPGLLKAECYDGIKDAARLYVNTCRDQ